MANDRIQTMGNTPDERSYFDGGFWGMLGYSLLAGFVTSITFGIAYPWMVCMKQRWVARHTVVCGKRMRFDGTGGSLIGHWLLWLLLTLVTFGIYGYWLGLSVKKWITQNTHYQGEQDNNSYFDGGIGGFIGINLLYFFLSVISLGLAIPWAEKMRLEWEARHTVIDSRRHVFTGSGGSLFLKRLLWGFLTGITLGIFAFWVPIKMRKWVTENTIDNAHTTDALIRRGEYRAAVQASAAHLHTQRVQDEMELIKNGINDYTDQDTLLHMAESGCRSAQFAYVQRYSGGDYSAEPYLGFLRSAALQGYAPSMSLYSLSGLCTENAAQILAGAAANGQIPAMVQLMRNCAAFGLHTADETQAVPALEEAVRWYDILIAGQNTVSREDTATYERCQMKLRRIRTKTAPRKMGAAKVIGVVTLVLAGIALLGALIGGIASVLGIGRNGSGPDFKGQVFTQMEQSAMAGLDAGVVAMPDGGAEPMLGSGVDRQTFMDRFRAMMEGDYYYQIESVAADENKETFTLQCSYYYWVSYFEMTVYYGGAGINRIVFEGPRVYETIDERINGLEFQSAVRVIYEALGLGYQMDITPDIDAGADYTQTYGPWNFHYTHTGDHLLVDIQAG